MNEMELQLFFRGRFVKEDEAVDWKDWQSLKHNVTGREGDDAVSYVSGISNMEGGHLLIGVDNAFGIAGIRDVHTYTVDNLKSRILGFCENLPSEGTKVTEFIANDTGKRVWLIDIPKHLPRKPVSAHGQAWQRIGDALVKIRPDRHDAIVNEPLNGSSVESDWSSEISVGVAIDQLDKHAISELKRRWSEKSNRPEFLSYSNDKALYCLNLASGDDVTNAAVVLLGTRDLLSKVLPDAEIIFEWRQDITKTTHDFRVSWRDAFLNEYEDVWSVINARNLRIPFQEGLIQREVNAFHEKSIREAVMNVFAHRDYSKVGRSAFIQASPEGILFESPGGFPPGVTAENALTVHVWRNRRLMEVLEKIGLVERSGQGIDDIFRFTIADGKGLPDLMKSDETTVRLKIPALVVDPGFIKFLERIVSEKQIALLPEDFYYLEQIREGKQPINSPHVERWIRLGIIERVGRTSGTRYFLSRHYYTQEKHLGTHTRLIGLSREARKALILDHLRRNKQGKMSEFVEAFPDNKATDITNILQELRRDNRIQYQGATRGGHWVLV